MRIVEVFGPTVQGEGPRAGRVTHFVRFGGCDYRCTWCDTVYAVDPAQVRQAPDLSTDEVIEQLDALAPAPMVVLSGGNPALQKLDGLIDLLGERYECVAVETQGSVWRPWLRRVDTLVVSPKPPSSGEATPLNALRTARFMQQALTVTGLVLKIVIFDDTDLAWARDVHATYPHVPLYLSAGTDQEDVDHAEAVAGVGERYAWLCERVAHDSDLVDASVLPQLHVIAWGHRVGV